MIYLFTEDDNRKDRVYHYHLYEGGFVIHEGGYVSRATIITYNSDNDDITHHNYGGNPPILPDALKIIPLHDKIEDLFICLENHKLDLILDGILI